MVSAHAAQAAPADAHRGSIILRVVFSWPGIRALFFSAVLAHRDYPVVMGPAPSPR
jgi:ABC-type dipeptide/oligopeptide/nickel transport system permease component